MTILPGENEGLRDTSRIDGLHAEAVDHPNHPTAAVPAGATGNPADAATPLIRVRNLNIHFRHGREWRRVVSGVSFSVAAGQCLALVGESGSGKSVTARSLLGLNGSQARVSADELTLEGRDLLSLRESQWRRVRGRAIGYILQDALVSLDPLRTIGRELRTAIRATGAAAPARARDYVLELLRRTQMPEPETRLGEYPGQLSGGLRQRALIATALAGNPRVLIADEPTTALDVSVQKQILGLFADLKRSGITLILISHDLGVVSGLADQVVIMRHGEVVEQGPTRRTLGAAQHAYTRELVSAIPRFTRVSSAEQPHSGSSGPATGAAAPEPILSAENITKRFAATDPSRLGRLALDRVSVTLHAGRTLGLVGESGSGKTTLGRIIAGIEPATSGRIVTTEALARTAGRARAIQFVYQDPLGSFDPRYTVERILGEALGLRFGHESDALRRQRIEDWLVRVGLDPAFRARRPLTLSGGQRQRVAIARALSVEPRLIVLDEPVSALDVVVQKQILELISKLQEETHVAFLFISHDLGVIQRVSHQVAVLRHGVLREYGDARQVLGQPRDAYTRELLDAVPVLERVGEEDSCDKMSAVDPAQPSGLPPTDPISRPETVSEKGVG